MLLHIEGHHSAGERGAAGSDYTGATFRIRKNEPIKRDLLTTNMEGYASKLMAIQENYNKATTPADKAAAIAPLNLMQTTW